MVKLPVACVVVPICFGTDSSRFGDWYPDQTISRSYFELNTKDHVSNKCTGPYHKYNQCQLSSFYTSYRPVRGVPVVVKRQGEARVEVPPIIRLIVGVSFKSLSFLVPKDLTLLVIGPKGHTT